MTAVRHTSESKPDESLVTEAFKNPDLIKLIWRIMDWRKRSSTIGWELSVDIASWLDNFRALIKFSGFIDAVFWMNKHGSYIKNQKIDFTQQEICENHFNLKGYVVDKSAKEALVKYITDLQDVDSQKRICESIMKPKEWSEIHYNPNKFSQAAKVMWTRRGNGIPYLTDEGSQLNKILKLYQKICAKTPATVASHGESKSEVAPGDAKQNQMKKAAGKPPMQVQVEGDRSVPLSKSRLSTFHNENEQEQELSVIADRAVRASSIPGLGSEQ